MTIRKVPFVTDEFFHIYSRGVDKRLIFLDDNDRRRFMRLLYLCNGDKPVVYKLVKDLPLSEITVGEKLVSIGAYCLMPNHFHILIRGVTEDGIVRFMSKLLTAYSCYFNKKYSRTGALFSSEFKAEHLDTDNYLKYIFSYIHLNCLKLIDPHWKNQQVDTIKVGKFLDQYRYSSYAEYKGVERDENIILNKEAFPEYFPSVREFEAEITDWLSPIQARSLD